MAMKCIYNFGIYCYKQLVALAGIRNAKARKPDMRKPAGNGGGMGDGGYGGDMDY